MQKLRESNINTLIYYYLIGSIILLLFDKILVYYLIIPNAHLIRKGFIQNIEIGFSSGVQKSKEMTSKFYLRKLLSRSNSAEEKRQILPRSDYEDQDSDCKILQTSALKIQNPDALTLRVLSKNEEKKRSKTLYRLVGKDGYRRTKTQTGIRMQTRKLVDIFTTMMDYSWPVLVGLICATYFLDWLSFAGVWYIIAWIFNDLTEEGKMKQRRGEIVGGRHTL